MRQINFLFKLFSKSVYLDLGGFDTALDFLEDWDLWKRYGIHYKFHFNNKTTSEYRTPADESEQKDRKKDLINAYETVKYRELQNIINFQLTELIELLDQVKSRNKRKVEKERIKTNRLKKKLKIIQASSGYRLGKTITFLPQMMRTLFRRVIHNE